ncbi:hypothetical protein [Burkholderia mayonis]|uniref:Uncharacterized protein n=1 Tax=Burkholderia mayonis TaxID=1385591 RepID=A0A1B4G362_9BURK|nr:hypothetical protein [Burkholderia mayonis]AOJ10360.1 hypothetical protein WS71_24435 [Burkholderia mayonis]KVE53659.1 hypothetical protein WS71_06340 [Burkholderia mayonis]
MEKERSWTTGKELEFIEYLAAKRDAVALLSGYLTGMHYRTDFGDMDPNQVLRFACDRLAACQRRAA